MLLLWRLGAWLRLRRRLLLPSLRGLSPFRAGRRPTLRGEGEPVAPLILATCSHAPAWSFVYRGPTGTRHLSLIAGSDFTVKVVRRVAYVPRWKDHPGLSRVVERKAEETHSFKGRVFILHRPTHVLIYLAYLLHEIPP